MGLRGQEISLPSRITALADTVDAVLRDRPYRAARDFQEVLSIVRKQRGEQFDPLVVDAFLRVCSRDLDTLGDALELDAAAPDSETVRALRRALEGARELWGRSAVRTS